MKRLTTFLAIFLFAFVLQGQTVLRNGSTIIRAYDANQPLNIEDECKVWLDGKDAGQFTMDGTYVDDWIGKGSLGVHAANGNANTTRPTYDPVTGRVTFTAANETFLQSAAFGAALAQPNTIFVVYKTTGLLTNNTATFDAGTSLGTAFAMAGSRYFISAGEVVSIGSYSSDVNDNIQTGLFNGASSEFWVNGISNATGDVGAASLSKVTLGARGTLVNYADVEIMEVIVYNADISDVDRDKITGYLADKWSITATTDFKGYVLTNTAAAVAAWASPTGKEDDAWTDAANIYDGNILTSGQESTNSQSVTLTIPSISCNKVRLNAGRVAGGEANLKIEVYYSAAFHQIHSGVLTEDTWVEIDVGSTEDITKAKITTGDGINSEVWEFEFWSL